MGEGKLIPRWQRVQIEMLAGEAETLLELMGVVADNLELLDITKAQLTLMESAAMTVASALYSEMDTKAPLDHVVWRAEVDQDLEELRNQERENDE